MATRIQAGLTAINAKRLLVNLAVLVVSAGIGLLLCEFASRLILNPADYLSVEMVHDEILGAVLPSSAASGFDKWGFRNRSVPETTDIVAIGDSHTYGNTAKMEESWPKVLERLTGRRVYNMGMGGYGPNQYFYLLTTKALRLKPRLVMCGLYLGDDFENAFTITYGLNHWAYLRQLQAQNVNPDIWEAPQKAGLGKGLRVWLSRHSVIYEVAFHASVLGRLQGEFQIKNTSQFDPSVTALIVPEKNIREAFRPKGMLSRLDQKSPSVREGMRITFELLTAMNDICHRNSAEFMVVIIPTKELVFSAYLEHNSKLPLGNIVDGLLANERLALAKTEQFLNDSKIPYVNTLPALTRSAGDELYARTAADMHPNKNGYRVIGEAVFGALKNGTEKKD